MSNPLHSSESSQWYTPPRIVEIAREILGEIDLDPASHEVANTIVRASRFYDGINGDGLALPWAGRVFANPPYSKKDGGPIGLWVGKLLAEYTEGDVDAFALVVNATPDREWFVRLHRAPNVMIALLPERVSFLETILAAQMREARNAARANRPPRIIMEDPPGFAAGPSPTHGTAIVCGAWDLAIMNRFDRIAHEQHWMLVAPKGVWQDGRSRREAASGTENQPGSSDDSPGVVWETWDGSENRS